MSGYYNFYGYSEDIRYKLLYFCKPHLSATPAKDIGVSCREKLICTFINRPELWTLGNQSLEQFCGLYPHSFKRLRSFFTAHFKEQEAYGLTCLESMMLGTPIITLKRYMEDKTLGHFFLNQDNSIFVNTVEEAINRVKNITLDEYEEMSHRCREKVIELTSDESTIERLRLAVFD